MKEVNKEKNIFKCTLKRVKNPSYDAVYLVYRFLRVKCKLRKYAYKRLLMRRYNIFIANDVTIGNNLKLPHPTGIVIGKGANIGNNVTIYQQVTIGGKNIGDTVAGNIADIKDNVVIFSGVRILGNVTVEEHCTIGANAVVIKSLEANGVYAGVPAHRIK